MAKVRLGDVEIDPGPRQEIRFVGVQMLVKQDIPGAGPSYQDMGTDEETVSWDGVLDGTGALTIALQIEAMRQVGRPVNLVTGLTPAVQVCVKEFNYRPKRIDRVEYDITLVREIGVPDFSPPATSEAGTTATGTAVEASGTHTVVAGDTLYAIAQTYMGDGNLWPAIAQLNGISDPAALPIGALLRVPSQAEAGSLAASYKSTVATQNQLLSWVEYKLNA